ncbi:MAG TPA: hypothetical protein VNX65_02410 [Patescibacteria group bacterium]|jgi:hypothetical protein|nr:hypothetical protein [Patescibacteria group bacterium]
MILDKRVTIQKLIPTTGSATQETYVTHSGFLPNGVQMNIQPASPEFTMQADGQFFKTYKAFTTNSGVVEGYRVVVSGTNETYIVQGREAFNYGVGRHYELALVKATRGPQ